MTVKVIYKERRSEKDRRTLFPANNVMEKRNGMDRRKLDETLKKRIKEQKNAEYYSRRTQNQGSR